MTERPILFSASMVRAILAGQKTQTRRVVKVPKHIKPDGLLSMTWNQHDTSLREQGVSDDARAYLSGPRWDGERLFGNLYGDIGYGVVACPYGAPGDRLWVRETWAFLGTDMNKWGRTHQLQTGVVRYTADASERRIETGWQNVEPWMARRAGRRPSIHMPRWASRLTLEITGVRVERLQKISEKDAIAEGVDAVSMRDVPRQATPNRRTDFAHLWNKINAKRGHGWDVNPWVWVLEFKRVAP